MTYTSHFKITDYVLLLLVTSFCFTACQPEQKPKVLSQKKIYANYYIRYIQGEGDLKAEASFLIGDSIQNRTPKQFSSVLFGNKKMLLNKANLKKPYYEIKEKIPLPKNIVFRFVNDRGQQEEDQIAIADIPSFSVTTPFNRSKDLQLSWSGAPLDKGESIVLLFTDEQNRTTSMILNGPSSTPQIGIPAAKLKSLKPGEHSLYLVRKNRTTNSISETDPYARQVSAVTEYYSNSIDLDVIE